MTITLVPGQHIGLSAISIMADGYSPASTGNTVYNWTSSNPAVATVVFNTKWVNPHTTAHVEALTVGSTTITCTDGSLTKQVVVNVIAQPAPASIKITEGATQDPEADPSPPPRPHF